MSRPMPAEVFPPGEFIREELEARGWTQADLADILGVSLRLVNEIINAKRSITPETAKLLGNALGTNPQLWMNLESAYQLWRVRPTADADIARRARLFAKAPVKEMIRRNWIEGSNNVEVLEQRILAFFGIKTLDEEPRAWGHASRKSTPYEIVTPAQNAWLFRARHLARAVDAKPFSEASFEKVLETMELLLANVEDVRHVPKILAESGIRFVVVEHLEQTRIDGACLWLGPKAPVVALSLRYDRIDALWYTLMHELGHVKMRHGLDKYHPVDIELLSEGVVSAKDKTAEEREANKFATEFLVPQGELADWIRRTRPLYSGNKIRMFAALHKIHPGIVVGQLQHRREINYAHNRKMLDRIRHIVTQSALTDGWGHTPPAGL